MKPILLVPMAGKGQRFIDGGFTIPKQLIQVGDKKMIEWSFDCIEYTKCEVIFIVRKEQIEEYNIDHFLISKFGSDIKIIISETNTEGTVCSCLLSKEYINNDRPLFITTLDVYFEPHFDPNKVDLTNDGCILTLKSDNPGYSYSLIWEDGFVKKTAEKEVISDLASVGLYCFTRGSDFVSYAEKMIERNVRTRNEFYVCPLYNLLIEDGLKITTQPVESLYHMGTPQELKDFLEKDLNSFN